MGIAYHVKLMGSGWHEGDGWEEAETAITSVDEIEGGTRVPGACIVHLSEPSSSTRTHVLDSQELTIGRAVDCDLNIASGHVSRLHARIVRTDAGWTIIDNDSANGILVNGSRCEKAALAFGDRIELGRGEVLLFRPYDSDYQRALEAQRLESLGRLSSGIAHDFNNALMAIVGAASWLQDELGEEVSVDVEEALADILTASANGADLARQLLSFSRRREDTNELFNVGPLIDEVARLAQRTFDQGIQVRTEVQTAATLLGNRSQFVQVLMNLCLNARDAMPDGGELSIELRNDVFPEGSRTGSFVCICVADTGVGMTPEVRERIFEPFFSTKGEGRGTGLGLATSYGIIRNCGGTIDVKSSPGEGTCMELYLPAQAALAMEPIPISAPSSPTQILRGSGSKPLILLAEDQDLVRRHTSRILARLGYRVIEATDGVEAVEAVRDAREPICLALLDLQMPKRSGDEACRMIREIDPGIPIVMVSGNIQDPRIERLVETGEVDVLAKPFGPGELQHALGCARIASA